MALWRKFEKIFCEHNYSREIRDIYGSGFPLVVRASLANFIEKTFWSDTLPLPSESGYSESIAELINQFIDKVENFECTNGDPELKRKLNEAAKMFRKQYSGCPKQLFKLIRESLEREIHLLQDADLDIKCNIHSHDPSEIVCKLDRLKRRGRTTAEYIKKLKEATRTYYRQCGKCTEANVEQKNIPFEPNPDILMIDCRQRKESAELEMNREIAPVIELQIQITRGFYQTIAIIKYLYKEIIEDKLAKWKRKQQLAANGYPSPDNLDQIQDWCERLAEVTLLTHQQVSKVEKIRVILGMDNPALVDKLSSTALPNVAALLKELLIASFIIEKQPPQILKIDTPFSATVRFLIGDKLGVHAFQPTVTASFISDSHKVSHQMEEVGFVLSAGEVISVTGSMEFDASTKQLSAKLKDMQLKKIYKSTVTRFQLPDVTDEKFSLLFESQFSVDKIKYRVWTVSLPVVVISAAHEEVPAWGTLTWYNGFKTINGRFAYLPEKVPWIRVKKTLSQKLKSLTGRGLNEDNMLCLAEKLFEEKMTEHDNPWLTYAQFCKEFLPDQAFTFWQWFYAISILIRKYLQKIWEDGAIMGFVAKKKAENMLAKCPAGTFLLRFSDSVVGGITIAFVSELQKVVHLGPFTSYEFEMRSLPNMISDLSELKTVYPDTAKETYFEKYYTRPIRLPESDYDYIATYRLQIGTNLTPSRNVNHKII